MWSAASPFTDCCVGGFITTTCQSTVARAPIAELELALHGKARSEGGHFHLPLVIRFVELRDAVVRGVRL